MSKSHLTESDLAERFWPKSCLAESHLAKSQFTNSQWAYHKQIVYLGLTLSRDCVGQQTMALVILGQMTFGRIVRNLWNTNKAISC